MNDLHEITFQWPHPEPNHVIVTGTFDQWSSSITLSREGNGFKATTTIPWEEKISYKYIVDGNWTTASDQPTETDNAGNVNNVYTSPSQPPPPVVEAPPPVLETVEPAKVEEAPEPNANGHVTSTGGVLSTVAATEGTTSAFDYVASGVGAAIHAVVGVDPINGEKVSVKEPTSESTKEEPTLAPASEPEPAPAPLPISPAVGTIVPITIVPVNASENNHAATNETPAGSESPSTHEPAKPVAASSSVPELPSPLDLPPTNGTAAPILEAAVIAVPEPSPPTATEPAPSILPEKHVEEVQAPTEEVTSVAPVAQPDESKEVLASTPATTQVAAVPIIETIPITPHADAAATAVQPEETKEVLAAIPAITQIDKPVVPVIETVPASQASATPPAPIESETKATNAEPAVTNDAKEEARPATSTPVTEAKPESSPGPSAPTTPVKSSTSHIFPSSESPNSANSSPSGTTASRKKRQSIFGKIHLKNIFSSDKKEKEKDEKTKKGKP